MIGFNRALVSLVALLLCGLLAGLIYLVWEQARMVGVNNDVVTLRFDVIADTRAEQILATLVLAGLMLPSIALLVMELMPRRKRLEVAPAPEVERERYGQLEARVESLQRRLDEQYRSQPIANAPVYDGQSQQGREQGRRNWRFLPSRH